MIFGIAPHIAAVVGDVQRAVRFDGPDVRQAAVETANCVEDGRLIVTRTRSQAIIEFETRDAREKRPPPF